MILHDNIQNAPQNHQTGLSLHTSFTLERVGGGERWGREGAGVGLGMSIK